YDKLIARYAFNYISTRSCLNFEETNKEARGNLIYVVKIYDGSFANVGRQPDYNLINMDRNRPFYTSVIIHEIFHALGRFHEHSRYDRDNYVRLNTENIIDELVSQFDKRPRKDDTFGVSYDINSIMHYPGNAFSKNGKNTLESVDPSLQYNMGQFTVPTIKDLLQLN
ncbi:MAG: hypothetical protein MHPSP_002963, partial [Paramarteilia canceri]